MPSLFPPASRDELLALSAFRSVARDVHRIFGRVAHIPLLLDLSGEGEARWSSFPEDAVRSLALAVRQPYMKTERTYFPRICEIIERCDSQPVRGYVQAMRGQWTFATASQPGLVVNGASYGGAQVFDTWLNAHAVHRDQNKEHALKEIQSQEPWPTWVVQCVIKNLSTCVLNLDLAVADVLGEPALPDEFQHPRELETFRF